jgi:uncharacterized protein
MEMMKTKKIVILMLVVLSFSFLMPMEILGAAPRLVDEGGLLSSSEFTSIINRLDEVSAREDFGVAIVVVNDYRTARDNPEISNANPNIFTNDLFAYYNYGVGLDEDGILLMISLDMNDIWITTSGYGITAFTDAGIDEIIDTIIPDFSDGLFYDGFNRFIDMTERYLEQARTGTPYDVGNMPRTLSLENFLIPLGIGVIGSLLIMLFWASRLKSVRSQNMASNYVRDGSLIISTRSDRFLFRNVVRRARPKQNNSGGGGIGGSTISRGSGGGSFGGRGGRF